jgi:hypothetical protein
MMSNCQYLWIEFLSFRVWWNYFGSSVCQG